MTLGVALAGVSLALLGAPLVPLVTGAAGVVLGSGYLLSPTWKLAVVIDYDGFEVGTPRQTKFRVAWQDVARVVASPSTHTCFVDAGVPEKSLLVPGVGAPAPYDLENRAALVAAILAHVDPAKVTTVETLEAARAQTA